MTKVNQPARTAAKTAEYRIGTDGYYRLVGGQPFAPLPDVIQLAANCEFLNCPRVIANTRDDIFFYCGDYLTSEPQLLDPARHGLPENLTVWQVGGFLFFKSQIPENGL